MALRVCFLMQTNTALPVLAYMAETRQPESTDWALINPGFNEDSLSHGLRDAGVRATAALVAPQIECFSFKSDLMDVLRPNASRTSKIVAIHAYKKTLRTFINQMLRERGLSLHEPIEWIADVGLQPWTKYGLSVLKAKLRIVPHEMRHFSAEASTTHYNAFAMPGQPGSLVRLLRLYTTWATLLLIGCQKIPPHWPYMLGVEHVSFVSPLKWHSKCTLLKGIHEEAWYRGKALHLRAEIDNTRNPRIVLLLSQIKQDFNGWVDRISSFLLRLPNPRTVLVDVKMHPTEPGYWHPLRAAVEGRVGFTLGDDARINLYPSELWFAAVDYNAAVGQDSGSVNVAREIYGIPTYNFDNVIDMEV